MHSDGQNNTNTNPQALWTTAQQITAAQLDVCVQLAGLLKLLTWSSDDRDGGSNGNGGDGGDGNAVDTPSMLLMPAAVVGEVAAVSQQVRCCCRGCFLVCCWCVVGVLWVHGSGCSCIHGAAQTNKLTN